MKWIFAGLVVIAAAVIVSSLFVPVRFFIPNTHGEIEYAKAVTKLELRRYELIGRPNNLRNWLSMQDGAPGQEVTMKFVGWGLTHQSDFVIILEGFPEEKKSPTINFLSSMINDRFAEDAFLVSFKEFDSPGINELRTKVLHTEMMTVAQDKASAWLFSRSIDLSVFLGSAVLSLVLLAVGWQAGILDGDSPEWTWIWAVLLIDVAHVWSTSFRVYFDVEELNRRFWLYLLVPVFGYAIGVALYSEGELLFWKVLAAIAVFHFVRQQYGWVNLYRRKLGETAGWTWWIDAVAVYLASVYPLAYWMTRLPRNFEWFVQNDFVSLPAIVETVLFPTYVLALIAYFGKSIYQYVTTGFLNIGKDIIVATTAICWYVGIVYFNSDYAFTVTNVIIHGVPYFALIWVYAKMRRESSGPVYRTMSSNILIFLATLWALAYIEELFWHRGVWHDKQWLFGSDWEIGDLKMYLVPLLALPQLTHYVLDGFIWRRKNNPDFKLI